MPALIVTIAPPGAGKSTFLEERLLKSEIVCLDDLRERVSGDSHDQTATPDAVVLLHTLLAMRCRRRLLTAVDATNVRTDVRGGLLDHAYRNLMLPVAVVLDMPVEECLTRNAGRDRPVPEPAVRRLHAQFMESVPADGPVPGFDLTRRISLTRDRTYGPIPPSLALALWLR